MVASPTGSSQAIQTKLTFSCGFPLRLVGMEWQVFEKESTTLSPFCLLVEHVACGRRDVALGWILLGRAALLCGRLLNWVVLETWGTYTENVREAQWSLQVVGIQ
jgi:hypothetical protein